MGQDDRIEKVLWSIALPGFGQILNGQLIKGILFITLEFIINVQSNLNEAIVSSFLLNIKLSIEQTNYQWLMFYPCIYMFAIWDAYKNSEGTTRPYSFLSFVLPAYLGTIGVIYSGTFRIKGVLLGPVWLPICCLILGSCLGSVIRKLICKYCKI